MATGCFYSNSTGDVDTKCCKIAVNFLKKYIKLSLESNLEVL